MNDNELTYVLWVDDRLIMKPCEYHMPGVKACHSAWRSWRWKCNAGSGSASARRQTCSWQPHQGKVLLNLFRLWWNFRSPLYDSHHLCSECWHISSFCSRRDASFTSSWEITAHLNALSPRVGSGTQVPCVFWVERIDLLSFLAGCCKRRLNRALCVLSLLSLGYFECILCCSLLPRWLLHYFVFVFCFLIVQVRLSVLVQVIDWKE